MGRPLVKSELLVGASRANLGLATIMQRKLHLEPQT
jgi:hypothetical protein